MNKEFVIRRKIRFGDCDPGGILYTPRIGYFVVEAILDFISACFGAPAEKAILELGVLPPARSLNVEFLKPMAWDDEIEIRVGLKEIRKSAFVFTVNGFVKLEHTFSAELTQVCIDAETKQPVKVPDRLGEVLENFDNVKMKNQ
ncbi:MAG: thioesterase family protein [Bacteroidota bacterium]